MRLPIRVAAVTALVVAASACSAGNVFELRVGDCFQDEGGDVEEVSSVEIVDCDEPHDNEVFHTFEMEGGDEFPGMEAVADAFDANCFGERFERFIGQPYETSQVEVVPITPTPRSWEDADDREVVCAVRVPGERVEGSLEGSGR